ncbi:MAG: carboxypeptidase regulatory-like domain-containing protein [bacterium]|nr:carboxypeptidase regulatory-like domain-containing protein [bacterium]
MRMTLRERGMMRTATLAILIALIACGRCLAGTSGVLNGYLRDTLGRPIVGARVVAVAESSYARTVTDRHGFFAFLDLPPDLYSVLVGNDDGRDAYALGVRVQSDQTTFLPVSVMLARCPTVVQNTVSADQSAQTFRSVDLTRAAMQPPNVASLPLPFVPLTPPRTGAGCL